MNYYDNKNDYNQNNGNFRYGDDNDDDVVSVGSWVVILIILAIPIVNIIALLIMAFSQGNMNIKNFAKASLILMVIPLALIILFRGCMAFQ